MVARNVKFVVEAFEGFAESAVKTIVLEVAANLVRAPGAGGTPVDTGWARANWAAKIGSADTTQPRAGSRDERSAGVGAAAARQQSGLASVATGYRLALGEVHLSNNVPYISRLNGGSSRQAPRNFVQKAIAEAVGTTRDKFAAG